MWNIADIPLVVTKWAPESEKEEAEPEIQTIPMWITIKNVPHKMFSWKGLGFIASVVGHPVRLHPETEQCVNFEEAKMFVEAEVKKIFPKKHRFQSKTGIDAEVEFIYPWLPAKCSLCSKWGHIQSACVINGSKKLISTNNSAIPDKIMQAEHQVEPSIPMLEDMITKKKMSSQNQSAFTSPQVVADTSIALQECSEKVQKAAEEQPSVVDDSEENWEAVSPGKHCSSGERKSPEKIISLISPSRFEEKTKKV